MTEPPTTQPKVLSIVAEPLTAVAWEPFGWLPVADTDPRDTDHELEFAWGDPHVNVIAHTYDEIGHTKAGAVCDTLFRHDTHTQTLMVLDHPAIVAVAPAAVDFSDPAHLDTVRAFRLGVQDALVLARGTWHWGPFPIDAPVVQLFNVQGRRYAEDNASVSLPERQDAVVAVRS
jgi:ureidoglycolate lyase